MFFLLLDLFLSSAFNDELCFLDPLPVKESKIRSIVIFTMDSSNSSSKLNQTQSSDQVFLTERWENIPSKMTKLLFSTNKNK